MKILQRNIQHLYHLGQYHCYYEKKLDDVDFSQIKYYN